MPEGLPKLPGLKRQRLRRALSQESVAQRSGVARSTVIKLELGESGARPSTIRKLASALECAPDDLLIQSGVW